MAEGLGLALTVGRLLSLEWQGLEPDRTESLMFIYDDGVLDTEGIRLAPDELRSYAFVDRLDLDRHLVPRLSRRTRAPLLAVDEGRIVEMEHGEVVVSSSAAPAPR